MQRLLPIIPVLIAAALALNPVTPTSQKSSVLRSVRKCPSDANLAVLSSSSSMKDLLECAVFCVGSDICVGIHFSKVSSKCYHGSSLQLAALLDRSSADASDGCISYIKDGSPAAMAAAPGGPTEMTSLPALTTTPTALSVIAGLSSALASKLVIMFDFRQGYTNLANPAKYFATPRGFVTRDNQGAHFPGSSTDYIEVDMDGNTLASSYLDYPHNFSFYASVERQSWSQQNYHVFHNCSSGNVQGEFSDRNGNLFTSHSFSGHDTLYDKTETIQSMATNLVRRDNIPQNVSVAAVFTGINFATFFFNGTAMAGGSDLNYAFQGVPQCLRLGFSPVAGAALKGRFVCYVVAKAALKTEEIKELHRFGGF